MSSSNLHVEFLDPKFDPSQWVPASRKRLLLALYIDWLAFSVFLGLLRYAAGTLNPGWAQWPLPWIVLSFVALELVFFRIDLPSPGTHILSISLVKVRVHDSRLSKILNNRLPMVDARIKSGESWPTMILATLLMNEGAKALVRWTMWTPILPLFGMEVSEGAGVAALMAMGTVECVLSYWVFQLRPQSFFLGVGYHGLMLASTVMSWDQWDPWVREYTVRRMEFQGRPVDPERIEFMQRIHPEILVAVLIAYLLAWGWVRKRLIHKPDNP